MARDLDRQKQFTRRALLLGGGKALLLSPFSPAASTIFRSSSPNAT